MRSARKRMLASNRAEVGSTLVVRRLVAWDEGTVGASLRSAMSLNEENGLFLRYTTPARTRNAWQIYAKGLGARRRREGQTSDRAPITSTGWAELLKTAGSRWAAQPRVPVYAS